MKLTGKAYHKYFDGYTEIQVPGRNGKGTRVERIYTGEYYQQNLSEEDWKKYRLLYRFCYGFALAAFLAAALQSVESNRSAYVVLPSTLSILGLMWLSYVFLPFTVTKRKLKLREYRDRMNIISASALTAAFYALSGLGTLLSLFLNRGGQVWRVLLCVVLFFLGAAALFLLHRCEKNMEYVRVENEKKFSGAGYDIRYKAH